MPFNGSICGPLEQILTPTSRAPYRIDMLFVGDGYKEPAELADFSTKCDALVAAITSQPWYKRALGLRAYRLPVCSNNSLASNALGSVPTYFDSNIDAQILRATNATALASVQAAAESALDSATIDVTAVLVNTTTYGGASFGDVITVSANDPEARTMLLHEFGHQCSLGEEYGYLHSCDEDEPSFAEYPAAWPNPSWANVDKSGTSPKWAPPPGYAGPSSTYSGTGAACDDRDFLDIPGATVGAFEGAGWFRKGLYRPSPRCCMRKLSHSFCKVCVDQIIDYLT